MNTIRIKIAVILILTASYAQGNAQYKNLLQDDANKVEENNEYALNSSNPKNGYPPKIKIRDSQELEIESWMSDINYFTGLEFLEIAKENELEIEDWMTDEKYFTGNEFLANNAKEEALEIEDWMTNDKYFSGYELLQQRFVDEELKIEKWMYDTQYWN